MMIYRVLLIISILYVIVLSWYPYQNVYASHSVSASPSGGTYNTSQLVTLESTEPSTIYYTLDGTDPDDSSSVYSAPIEISASSTLKFIAYASSDNHVSEIVTEIYDIDTVAPQVTSTTPDDGATRLIPDDITGITIAFSEAMDESTINDSTFTIVDGNNEPVTGFTSYDSDTNSASFAPDFLNLGTTYTATLKSDVSDAAGNQLEQDFVWTFTTGGNLFIDLIELNDGCCPVTLIPEATFTITPDPFDLGGSRSVQDNGPDDSNPAEGRILILNTHVSSYVISETVVPDGFAKIYDNVIRTVHETQPEPSVVIVNRNPDIPIGDHPLPIGVPVPDLTGEQFDLYKDSATVGVFLGVQDDGLLFPRIVEAVGPDQISQARIATTNTLDAIDFPLESVLSETEAPDDSTAQDLFDSFLIPTYPQIDRSIVEDTFYVVPAFIIPYEDSSNNFVTTPIIDKVFPGQTLMMEQPSVVASRVARVEKVTMTFAVTANDVGFSFGITDRRPPGTPEPPLDVQALFLDVGFVGDKNFSDKNTFESSPSIDILVEKSIEGFDDLEEDGCAKFQLLVFDEEHGDWDVVKKLRHPASDTETQCGFTLEPGHFSKFAVGGVKGNPIATESERTGGGGGGGGPPAIVSSPSQFENEPLKRVDIQKASIENASGQEISNAAVGETIECNITLKNNQSVYQPYVSIMQVVDEDGFVHSIKWLDGTMTTGETLEIKHFWTADGPGNYQIQIMIWDGMDSPDALSQKWEGSVKIT